EMPVPVWGCPDLGLLDETPDSATVVSDDIWKKFDLDFLPLDHYSEMYYEYSFDDGVLPDVQDGGMTCTESREKIRHHDCMWAGLCISKEHNRTLPAKKDSQIQKKVPAGRSVLISRANTAYLGASLPINHQQAQQFCRAKYHLDSDGDSTRPDTPSSSSDTETEDEGPYFRHDQINIHEKLSECMSEEATKVASVNGNQRVTGRRGRRKVESQTQCHVTNIRNTLSDHCYHLNQPIVQNLEHLGVQTPSDSGESPTDSVTQMYRLSSGPGMHFILRIRRRINEFIHLVLLCPPKRRQSAQGRTKDPLNRVQLTARLSRARVQFAEFGYPHEYANHAPWLFVIRRGSTR
ncbi:unnamed protein product, partial [Heterotrigona itama]